ncbi:unnamed protein product [Arabidopsis thaliana]|uniref:(thale cress) hypothetical protein n=1 Tax=Arabidopsis thaliana TaxID=3702 RepID=A0A7G2ELY8_ARATH|nr:unnamed protein product [Arabidopsis thaliana]
MPVVAEYAKSNRSSCRSCSNKIAVKSLRLGLISKGRGGVDMTRWHHFDCFPTDSESIASVDDIQGLSALEKEDQDALTKLVEQCGKVPAKKQPDEKKGKAKKHIMGPKGLTKAATSSKVIADNAKSSRSSCNRCSQTIVSKDLRVGLVTEDSRGFDITRWHHLGCFPIDFHPIDSVEDIGGYSSLEKGDQMELKYLAEVNKKDKTLIDDVQKMDEGDDEAIADNELTEETKKGKHSPVAKLVEQPGEPAKEDEDEESKKPASDEISEQKTKDVKNSPDSSKVISEYAKSSRSTCKKCSQTIAAKELRLGLVTRNFRGFDMKQWHHLGCFPVDSDPIVSVEDIGGFSELQSGDQDALKELVQQCGKQTLVDKMDEDNDDTEAKIKLTEETNKRKHSEVGEMVEEDESLTKAKQQMAKTHKVNMSESTSQVEVEAEITLSASDVKDKYRLWHLIPFSSSFIFLAANLLVSQDANLLPKWKAFETVIFLERDDGLNDSEKIAAFDFDGCLAKTSVKIVGADAWSLMYPSIPEKLQSLHDQGYKLVIFTNESNIDRWKNKRQAAVDSKIGRLNSFIERVKVPIQVFIACGVSSSGGKGGKDDLYRKPKAGMWQLMKKHFNSGIAIDMDKSFYVGDAAGRKMDHSDADIKFAQASGLKFFTPEEYFIPSSTSPGT